jgi:hypothetical protein
MKINKERGFPSMFASIDYMHWSWKYCPMACQGQFQDKEKTRSIIHKLLPINLCGYGTHFLACMGETMMLMSLTSHLL